jgi:iron complex transport system substrate-binding protein
MKKKIIVFCMALAIIITGAFFSGCADGNAVKAPAPEPSQEQSPVPETSSPDTEESGIVVMDMSGREVRLDAPATSVVALTAADVETLFAIGAGDFLVGRGEYCNYPPEALDVQSVQSGYETNIEQIIALQPQLLIMAKMDQNEDQVRQCEDAGVTVFVTDAQNIDGTYTAIGSIGKLVGKETEAGEVIKNMKTTFADLATKAAAAGGERKSIYFEVSPLEYGLWTTGQDTFMNEVAELLGIRNIFDDVTGWAEISEEQVLERNPDYILTVGMYFGEGPTPIESILSRPGWESITAIKNESILNLTEDELSRPGPRLAPGARMLYEFVFGDGAQGDW